MGALISVCLPLMPWKSYRGFRARRLTSLVEPIVSTILGRKDPSAQVPVLSDTNTTSSSASGPPLSLGQGALHDFKQYSASAPHFSTTGQTSKDGGQKRSRSKSPSPINNTNTLQGHVNKAKRSSSSVENDVDAPKSSISSMVSQRGVDSQGSEGERFAPGRAFERVFIGYCAKPSTIPSSIAYWHDDKHVIFKDAYPKAKVHLLVVPRRDIDKVTELSGPEGVNIVEQLVERASWVLEKVKKTSPVLEFRMGFHVRPSLKRLHMHVISQDFCSEALKKKHHWNSFTTAFFVTPEQVISAIKAKGSFSPTPKEMAAYEALLKLDLKCNQCKERLKNMPALKKHLQEHFDLKAKAKSHHS
ncbi:HIT-like domain-containing protein [Gamsiella multidivaricata]|uniref:HIT-like domain-containing protein n=1 Tax=Gamsiella multidivaricata TaxID=101098 RepID=UPI0022211684|nr:HIT-like domain-containing protein [Gamsiella multidivaricata]KAI7823051.1 HIT-like domain-containing protein [Gamsiella multidivaricata]